MLISRCFVTLRRQKILLSILAFSAIQCTKKGSQSSSENSPSTPAPSSTSPSAQEPASSKPSTTPANQNIEIAPLRFALSSLAGEGTFCQNFSTKNQLASGDLEGVINKMAGAHAGIPEEITNPFTVQTLALIIRSKSCDQIPQLITSGHCALVVNKQLATGTVVVETEQRLLWKDIPVLAQAISVKTTIDAKTNIINEKNATFANLQKQISQQRTLLQILQATSGGSTLIKEAQTLLSSLQEQIQNIENEVKLLENELKPLQDELNKRVEELNTARSVLKTSCHPVSMGATSATWKEN